MGKARLCLGPAASCLAGRRPENISWELLLCGSMGLSSRPGLPLHPRGDRSQGPTSVILKVSLPLGFLSTAQWGRGVGWAE